MSLRAVMLRLIRDVEARGLAVSGALLVSGCACPTPEIVTHDLDRSAIDSDGTYAANSVGWSEPICQEHCAPRFEEEELRGCVIRGTNTNPPMSVDRPFEGKIDCYYGVEPNCAAGRRPAALVRACSRPTSAATWLAHLAHLEAASVPAFRELARDLAQLGAPASLVAACRAAARDEIRHAARAGAEARLRGAAPPPVVRGPSPPRTASDIAIDNAVEGCVRETYGALELHWMARHAPEPSLRALAASLAADETRHAALARRIDRWLTRRLSPSEQTRVAAARRDEERRLRASVAARPVFYGRELGLPDARTAAALVACMAAEPAMAA
jgi:hypothetical protein